MCIRDSPEVERFRSDWVQDFGYMKTSPEEIGEFTRRGGVKGVYLAQNVDYVFWEKLDAIKKRDGFKMMWEIESPSSYKRYLPDVLNAMKTVDIFSINIQEAQTLFLSLIHIYVKSVTAEQLGEYMLGVKSMTPEEMGDLF